MAVLAFSGFESRQASTNQEWQAQSSAVIVTSPVRSGNVAMQINRASGQSGFLAINGRNATGALTNFGRTAETFYTVHFRFEDIPSGTTNFIEICTGTPASVVSLRVDSSGNIALVGATTSSTIATISADQWYRADIRCTSNGTSGAKIDGGTEQTCTANNLTQERLYLGRIGTTAVAINCYYDDVWVDSTAFPGAIKVVALFPTGAGASSGWTTGTGSTFAEVDDCATVLADGDTSYIATASASTAHTFDLTSCATAGISGTIKAVQTFVVMRTDSTTGTSTVSARLRSGSTNNDTTAAELATAYLSRQKMYETDPQDAAAWTTTKVDACEVGCVTVACAQTQRCTAVALFVAYIAGGITEPIAPDGTLTTAGVLSNEIQPPAMTGTLTTAGALIRKATQALGGTLSTSGLLSLKATQALAGTLSTSGSLAVSRVVSLAADGALGTSGALLAKVSQAFSGTLSTAGSLALEVQRLLGGTLATAGALVLQVKQALSGTLTTAGSLTVSRVTRLAVDGTLNTAGALAAKASTAYAGTLSTAGSLAARLSLLRTYEGTLTTAGALTSKAQHVLAGTLTSSGTVVLQVKHSLGGTLSTAGTLVNRQPIVRTFTGTLSSAGALAARVGLVLQSTLTTAGALAARLDLHRTFDGTLATAGALTVRLSQLLGAAGTLTSSGALTRRVTQALGGTLTTSGELVASRIVSLQVAGTLATSGDLVVEEAEISNPAPPLELGASYVLTVAGNASTSAPIAIAGVAAATIAVAGVYDLTVDETGSTSEDLELAGSY